MDKRTKYLLQSLLIPLAVGSLLWLQSCGTKERPPGGAIYQDCTDILEVQGCEYILLKNSTSSCYISICHKGNCKNPIHNAK